MFGQALKAFGERAEVHAASLPTGGGVNVVSSMAAQGITVKNDQVQPMPQPQVLQQVPQPRQPIYQASAVVPMPQPLPQPLPRQPVYQASAVVPMPQPLPLPQPVPQPASVPKQQDDGADDAEYRARFLFILGFIIPILPLYVAITSDHNVYSVVYCVLASTGYR